MSLFSRCYIMASNFEDMKVWFEKRTKRHIDLVQKYCNKIYKYDPVKFEVIIERGTEHDASKYKEPEMTPYIYVSWQYKCKDDGIKFEAPDGMKEKMNQATEHHVQNNAHHPESHIDADGHYLINREDRDKPPEKLIDATEMKDLDIAEMVADWCAMSEEKNTDPKDWADKNVNIRWKFNDKQKDLIYELITKVWEN
jgi:hypothetical protein